MEDAGRKCILLLSLRHQPVNWISGSGETQIGAASGDQAKANLDPNDPTIVSDQTSVNV